MMAVPSCAISVFTFVIVIATTVSLDDDPSSWPGHMEPLGAKQKSHEIETLLQYPSPEEFFSKYVRPGRPFLLKEGAKKQPAWTKWTNEYFSSFPDGASEHIVVEPTLKEDRDEPDFYWTTFEKYVETYHNSTSVMINPVPPFLLKDLLIPNPLRCGNTAKLMPAHLIRMSPGGTISLLHNDNTDNIKCLFRGSNEVLFIDPKKYGKKVPADRSHGTYSTVDVEKVDFTRYPTLREVEYIKATMEEGDCMYVPYGWHQQVNGAGNKDKRNIGVDIVFMYQANHTPQNCADVSDDDVTATLDNLPDGREVLEEEEEENKTPQKPVSYIELFNTTLNAEEELKIDLSKFQTILPEIPGLLDDLPLENLTLTEDLKQLAVEIFEKLNVNKNDHFDKEDVELISSDSKLASEVEGWLSSRVEEMTSMIAGRLLDDMKAKGMIPEGTGKEEL